MRRTMVVALLAIVAAAGGPGAAGAQESGSSQPALRSGDGSSGPSFELVIQAPGEVRRVLERHLELQRYRQVADLDDAEIARLLVLAERDARQLVGTLGYFSPQIRITREAGNPPRFIVAVEPGAVTTIESIGVDFAGDIAQTTDPEAIAQRSEIRRDWGLPVGQRFTQERWDDAKNRALRELTARRYLAGRLADSDADVDAAVNRARLGVRLDSGPVYRLGELKVTGVELYDPVLVPRFSQLQPGSLYDRDALVEAQLRLTGSGYFDSAFIYVDPGSDPAAAPVQITVREAKLQRLVLGAGIATDSGPHLSVEHTHNRLPVIGWRTISKFDLQRKAPLLQTELTSVPEADLWRWSVLVRADRLEDNGLLTHGQRLRAGRFKSWGHIDRSYYVQYDRATTKPAGNVPVLPEDTGDGSALTANYLWTGRYFDAPLSPTEGYGLALEAGGGVTLAGDRAPFLRGVGRGLYYRPLAVGRLQLRGELGAVLARDSARLPATQLFRTGGDVSVRGYAYQEIGVALPGDRVGPGRFLASASVEWQRPIRRRGVVTEFESMLFVDAGAVADRVAALRPHVGVGAGVRWRSPVGPLEFALAYGFKADRLRLHMNVGVKF